MEDGAAPDAASAPAYLSGRRGVFLKAPSASSDIPGVSGRDFGEHALVHRVSKGLVEGRYRR
ncbi:hypothetical protein GCM10009549_27880 [Streptomyces thermoalcalitolerans]|uniref:Uncharacterized protein n=1 Tax=Streptomyces thermoalcalitolerans TaxID=65605 RepID=A0ABP3Z321_9ACTN